jgi:serine/threonine-protein kinase
MASVYLADDVKHDRKVALKLLKPELAAVLGAERFVQEIKTTASLQHPHILPLFDSGTADGFLFYVMPYVEGETLRARLSRDGALPIAEAVRLIRELADALAYAHEHGVMHRDLKPENVLLSGGHAVVADFGIAKAIAAATENDSIARATITRTGVAVGTPAYMAPEQAVGDPSTNHRADLYSLGVVAYELLSGAHPFAGRTSQALAAAHLTETPAPISERRADVPPAIADLVTRLLAKDPGARPQSAGDVVRAIDGAVTTGSLVARRRSSLTAYLAGAALLVVVAAVAAYVVRRNNANASATDASAIHTLAVLPFVNTSGSTNDDYFSDGLTDELAHALSRVAGLRVAGRTSSYAFKGKSPAAREVGKTLDVAGFIGGTVRRSGDRLRVTTQLVSTSDGKVLWDSVYESRSADVFAVQDELTRAIVAALAPALAARGGARPVRADVNRGTADEEAYEFYLKGHYYWLQRGPENLMRSAEYFRNAIARDPKFARAYAGLSMAYSVMPNFVADPGDTLPRLARDNAERAAMLDSTLGEAQGAVGTALDLQLRFRDALERYRAFARLDPTNATAHHWLGFSLLNLGRTDEALAELARAKEADPLALSPASAYSTGLWVARRFPESIRAARYVLTLDSTFQYALWTIGLAQLFSGQIDSAVQTLDHDRRLHPDDPRIAGGLVLAYAAAGRWPDAQRVREQVQRPGGNEFDGVAAPLSELVFGNAEPLIRFLTSDAGMRRYQKAGGFVGCNPLFDPLWSDARFRKAMQAWTIEPCELARPWPIRRRN